MATDFPSTNVTFAVTEEPRYASVDDESRGTPYAEVVKERLAPSTLPQPDADAPPVQFRIRSLLLLTVGFSVLFAVLRLLSTEPGEFVGGFAIFTGVAYFGMRCVEASGTLRHRAERRHARLCAQLPARSRNRREL